MAYLRLNSKEKLITWTDLIHLDFHETKTHRSWSIKLSNRDPEGFLVALRAIDPSILILGFFYKKNHIEGVLVHCEELSAIAEYLFRVCPPDQETLEDARKSLASIGIEVPA